MEHIDLDFSSAENDNNLLFQVSPISRQPESWGGVEMVGDAESGDVSQRDEQVEQLPEIGQSEEPQRSRSGKCNLRKSLAWDKAFFTSAGVLDPEELTNMIDGGEGVQKQFLPGIQEEMQRSTDSSSTLESDNFTLESLEADLFEDIRASIQKSSRSAKGSFDNQAILQGGDHDISSPNGDTLSPIQHKSKLMIKKVNGVHKIGVPKGQPKVCTGIKGSTKAIKPEISSSVVPRSAGRTAELASSLEKPYKGTRKSSATAPSITKVTFLGPSRLRTENSHSKAVSVSGAHPSKMSSSNVRGRVLPKPISTSPSSSRESFMAKRQSTRSSPKGASSESLLSKGEVKPPPSTTMRRKAPQTSVNSPSSRTTPPQPSSKNALKSEVTSKNSAIASYLMSSKVPSSISPASSVSEWSSTSSSSAVNQKSNQSRSSFGSSSCISVDGDALPLKIKTRGDNQIPCRQEVKRSVETIKKPSSQNGAISGSTLMKPTGLRMPTPKIGFFDGGKSVRASSGGMQPVARLPVATTKVESGVSPRGIQNTKHKVSKLPTGRILTARKHETEKKNAPLAAKENLLVTSPIGDHEKTVEVTKNEMVNVQENVSEEHDVGSLKENLDVTKNEMVIGDNQDICLKNVNLIDSEYDDSKTGHEKMIEIHVKVKENESKEHDLVSPKGDLGVTKNEMVLGDDQHIFLEDVNLIDSEYNVSKTDHEKLIEIQVQVEEKDSEELDVVSLKGNLGVTNHGMVLGDNQDICLKDVNLVDSEYKASKTDHEKKVEIHVEVQENGREELDLVSLKRNHDVTKNGMVLGDDQDICLKHVNLVDSEYKASKTDHEKMVEIHVEVQENGHEEHDVVRLKGNLGVTKNGLVLGDNKDICFKDDNLVDSEYEASKTDHEKMVEFNVEVQENGGEEHDVISLKENDDVTKNEMVLGDNQDVCLKDVNLIDTEYNNSKTNSYGPINASEGLGDLKIDGHDDFGNSLNSCPKTDEKENVPLEYRMEQSSKVEGGVKSDTVNLLTSVNLDVPKNEMVLGDNQDICLKDIILINSEYNESETDSSGPIHASESLGDLKIDVQHDLGNSLNACCRVDEKENAPTEFRIDQSSNDEGGVKSDTVNLHTSGNLDVTKNEMVHGDNQHIFLKDANLIDSEYNDSKTDSCRPINAFERLGDPKMDGQHDIGNSLNSCCKIEEKENVPLEFHMEQSSNYEDGVKSDLVNLHTSGPPAVACPVK